MMCVETFKLWARRRKKGKATIHLSLAWLISQFCNCLGPIFLISSLQCPKIVTRVIPSILTYVGGRGSGHWVFLGRGETTLKKPKKFSAFLWLEVHVGGGDGYSVLPTLPTCGTNLHILNRVLYTVTIPRKHIFPKRGKILCTLSLCLMSTNLQHLFFQ